MHALRQLTREHAVESTGAVVLGAFLSGASAYVPFGFLLSVLGLIPLMRRILAGVIPWRIATSFAIVYTGTALAAYWSTLPLNWMGIDSWALGAFLVGAQWGLVVIPLAMLLAVVLVVISRVTSTDRIGLSIILIASVLTITEYAQMWLYALIMHSPGIPLAPQFSAHMFGYGIVTAPLVPLLARLGGVFLLSWLTIAAALILASMTYRGAERRAGVAALVMLLLASSVMTLESIAPPGAPLIAAAISVDSRGNRLATRERIEETTMLLDTLFAYERHIGLVVLPESLEYLESAAGRAQAWSSSDPRLTIVDTRIATTGIATKQSVFYAPRTGGRAEVVKTFLAPPREYVPAFIARLRAAREISHDLTVHGVPRPIDSGGFSVGGSICLESMSPRHARMLAHAGASVLTNASALGWFHESRIVHHKVSLMNRVRAAETDRYLVVASESAPAEIIAPDGSVVARTDFGATDAAVARIALRTTTTPYTLLGERVLAIPAILAALSFMVLRRPLADRQREHVTRRAGSSA